jgi:hypothetical protein
VKLEHRGGLSPWGFLADDVLSGHFTEEEPDGTSSLLTLRPCRIRYDVTKEWTNSWGLERA